jgi:hypothetical protein
MIFYLTVENALTLSLVSCHGPMRYTGKKKEKSYKHSQQTARKQILQK